jgi:hypothetical protein
MTGWSWSARTGAAVLGSLPAGAHLFDGDADATPPAVGPAGPVGLGGDDFRAL